MGRAYNGYMLSADSDSARIGALRLEIGNLYKDFVTGVVMPARAKFQELETYAAADPAVGITLEDGILDTVKTNVSESADSVMSNIESIIAAIDDYQDGDWSPENKEFIDKFLAANGKNPNGAPARNPGGGPGGGGGGGAESTATDEELIANEEISEAIQSTIPLQDATTTNDEEIVLGQVDGPSGQYSSEAVVPFSNNNETLEIGEDGVNGENGNSSELGTSLFGNSSFSVPSMLSGNGKVDGIKGAGVLGAAGVAAAAAAAIGGKVFYDKKHGDDEDEDKIDEDIAKMNEESGSDVSAGFMSGLSSVDFKNELLNNGEVDE